MIDLSRSSKSIAVFLALLASAPLARATAATGIVGGLGSAVTQTFGGVTLIDVSRPATAAGSYDSATVLWVGGAGNPCSAAFKLKFYRPSYAGSPDLTLAATRGPFDVQRGLVTVILHPPVPLLEGDLIAVTELLGTPCGGVALTASGAGLKTVAVLGDDPSASISICDREPAIIPEALAVIATTGGNEVRSGIVTGVGSVHGAANSNFKTATQIYNPGSAPISGRLVFHPIGQAGSPSDPSLPYAIPSFQATSIDDVVGAIGTTGLGSIDVIADASYAPLIVTHVFNDAGEAGTAGFTEPTVRPGDQYVLEAHDGAYLLAPADLAKYRMNIGVRSLAEGVSLSIILTNSHNGFKKSLTKHYAADFFDQRSAKDFLEGTDVAANDVVEIFVTAGRAIVYVVSVDNVTNDTSLQLGTRTRF